MTSGRLNFTSLNSRESLSALFLVLAFAAGGWKVWTRPPAGDFAFAPAAPAAVPMPPVSAEKGSAGAVKFDAQFVSSVPGQAVHAASIVELRNGDLRAVWFSGSREGASDVTIQSAVMNAASQRWSPESTLFNRQKIQAGLWRYVKKLGNPVIARAPDGSLSLWMVNVSLGGWAGSAITWSRSVDEGLSWSPPQRLVTSPFLNVSTLVKGGPAAMSNGQVSLPVYHEFATKFGEVLRLDAQGRVLDKTRIPNSRTNLQPVLLVKAPTQAGVYMRAGEGGKLVMSSTTDAGKTWAPASATLLPNPDSAVAGLVAANGRPWLALNPSPAGRGTLGVVLLQTDGTFAGVSPQLIEGSAGAKPGLTVSEFESRLHNELKAAGSSEVQAGAYVASARRQLCNAESCAQEFSYPFLLQTKDGYMHLVYTWHRSRIKHLRFDPMQPVLTAAAPN
ncbi:MAG: sialidase family protein [Pseudomonadota bacterium]